jgi:hypothetical protein
VFQILVYISFIYVPRPAIGFGDPTAAPTEAPTADPTQPTPLPPGTVICSQGCVLQSSEPAEIYYGHLLHNLTMPERYFRLTFDITATALATDHVVMSVLALHDGDGHQVLGLYTRESVNLSLTYRGSVVESGGPKLLINYMTEWTTIYVTYLDGMIYFATSFDSGDVFSYDVADYDGPLLSLGGVWQLYASADDPSSGGFIKNITIEGDTLQLLHSFSKTVFNLFLLTALGNPSAAPSLAPTAEPTFAALGMASCVVGCELLTGAATVIARNQPLFHLTLPTQPFSLSFKINGPALAAAGGRRNMFSLYDLAQGSDLLGVYTTEGTALLLTYQGAVVVRTGPRLVAQYASLWTVVTITFSGTIGRISTNAGGDVYTFAVEPEFLAENADMQAVVFASNQAEDSTGGYIKNINVKGV